MRVHPIALRSPLAHLETVRQYQLILRDDGLHAEVVPRDPGAASEVEAALAGAGRGAGGGGVPAHGGVVDAARRHTTGVAKLKLVRSEVQAGTAGRSASVSASVASRSA